MNCISCGKQLSNGLDTYGAVGQELCWRCYSEHLEEGLNAPTVDYYGLAPHRHDLTITGSYVNSTVFEPLTQYEKKDSRYWIPERGLWFWPDPEMKGEMGIWTDK